MLFLHIRSAIKPKHSNNSKKIGPEVYKKHTGYKKKNAIFFLFFSYYRAKAVASCNNKRFGIVK